MKEQAMSKNTAIEKLKSGSVGIGVLCIIVALFNLMIILANSVRGGLFTSNVFTVERYAAIRQLISSGILTVIMILAALMFFRIFKDGIPFTAKNFRTVRIIGILFLVNAVIPSVSAAGLLGTFSGIGGIVNPSALVEGLLFLFIAHMVRYGAMLQQESDETL